jgi:hypothetical protein
MASLRRLPRVLAAVFTDSKEPKGVKLAPRVKKAGRQAGQIT